MSLEYVGNNTQSASVGITPFPRDETRTEYISDFLLGIAFLFVGIAAAQR